MIENCIIMGLGQIGMGYDLDLIEGTEIYTHARAIDLHPAFNLASAVDISREQRTRFEERYRKPAFERLEVAVNEVQPDLVVIATSSDSHCIILSEVLEACKPRLILCEKPLAYETGEARKMVEMCKSAGVDLFVNYIRRTDPGVIEIKRRIDNGDIATPIKANAWYSKGILNNGSHFINLLELWLGNIVDATVINSGRLWDDRDPEPDFEITYERGTVIFRSTWEEIFSHHSIEILSPSGRLRYDKGGAEIEWQGVDFDPNFAGYRILTEHKKNIQNYMSVYQWHVYDQIHNYLAGGETTLCTGSEALSTLETIDSIIRQI